MSSRDILGSGRIATGFKYSEQEYQYNKASTIRTAQENPYGKTSKTR